MQPGYRPFPQQVAPMPLGSTPTRRGQAPIVPNTGAAHQLVSGAPHHLQPHQQPHRYTEQEIRHFGRTPSFQQQQQIHSQAHLGQHQHHPQHHPHTHSAPMSMAPGLHHHQAPPPMAHPGHPGHHMPQQMHPQHQAAAAAAAAQQQQVAQQQQNMAIEAAKRRSRKPTDKTIPDGVDTVIIGDGVQRYRDLRDFERRLDATMTRKRLDVVDSIQRNGAKRYKTLRVWISNTVENQLWQTGGGVNVDSFDFSTNSEASYRVKIEGRLIDDDEEEESEDVKGSEEEAKKDSEKADGAGDDAMETDGASAKAAKKERHHLTEFFRAITIEYNTKKSVLPENAPKPIEWKRPEVRPPPTVPGQPIMAPAATQVPEYDELSFQRPGDENINIAINMFRYEEPERFELDEILADIVDMKEATRAEAVMGLFEYIRLQGLQEDEEKRNFRCDDLLKMLVGNDIGYIPMLYEYVNKHIRPLPPVQLVYTIRVDEEFHKQQAPPATIYDIRVAVDDPLRAQLRPFVQSPQYMDLLRDVGALDEQLAILVQAISMSKGKHEFLSALAKDPAQFVRQWLSSQKRDLEVIMGESVRGVSGGAGGAGIGGGDQSGELWWRRGGQSSVWASQNARESVNLLLAKQPLIPRAV